MLGGYNLEPVLWAYILAGLGALALLLLLVVILGVMHAFSGAGRRRRNAVPDPPAHNAPADNHGHHDRPLRRGNLLLNLAVVIILVAVVWIAVFLANENASESSATDVGRRIEITAPGNASGAWTPWLYVERGYRPFFCYPETDPGCRNTNILADPVEYQCKDLAGVVHNWAPVVCDRLSYVRIRSKDRKPVDTVYWFETY